MKLQTNIPIPQETKSAIDYKSNVLLLGSCFSEHIGNKFDYFKFQTLQNPFGILFHPKAIETFVKNALEQKQYSENDVFFLNERWHCFDAHSQLSNPNKEILISDLNSNILRASKFIKNASHVIITLGTSWVYQELNRDIIVANCHKVAQKEFEKKLLSVEEITQSLQSIIELVTSLNPNVNFIFTVSPVRHLKDGFVENQQSKAHLISAIHNIIKPIEGSSYFPSYEIMMDELRDYRFYAEDMIHPNKIAINYIWEQFKNTWISADSREIMKQVDAVQKRKQHKPFNPNSKEYQIFLNALEKDIELLQKKYPEIKF